MNAAVVDAYVELCEQIAAQSLFSEGDAQRLYDRRDRLWHEAMSDAERLEAQHRLHTKGQSWEVRCRE